MGEPPCWRWFFPIQGVYLDAVIKKLSHEYLEFNEEEEETEEEKKNKSLVCSTTPERGLLFCVPHVFSFQCLLTTKSLFFCVSRSFGERVLYMIPSQQIKRIIAVLVSDSSSIADIEENLRMLAVVCFLSESPLGFECRSKQFHIGQPRHHEPAGCAHSAGMS